MVIRRRIMEGISTMEPLILFDNGYINPVTGGFDTTKGYQRGNLVTATIGNTIHVECTSTTSQSKSKTISTVNRINTLGYTKICIEMTGSATDGGVKIIISRTITDTNVSLQAAFTPATYPLVGYVQGGSNSYDINNDNYIALVFDTWQRNTMSYDVTKIWLE